MIRNYWLDQQEAEDMAYFRKRLFEPLNFPKGWERFERGQTAVMLESQRLVNEKGQE